MPLSRMNNNSQSVVKASTVKDMDLLKSLMENEDEGSSRQSRASLKSNGLSSLSSSSLSSSSSISALTHESSVSGKTKQATSSIGLREIKKLPERDGSPIDYDFFDTGETQPTANREKTSTGLSTGNDHVAKEAELSSESASRSDSVESEHNRQNNTSTFNFASDLHSCDEDSDRFPAVHDKKNVARARGRKRRSHHGRPKKSPKESENKARSDSVTAGTSMSRSASDRRNSDSCGISPWDYGESGTIASTAAKAKSNGGKRKKSHRQRQPIDSHRLEEDRQKMLEKKYEELRQLLTEDNGSNNAELDKELLQQTKQILRRYKLLQSGRLPGSTIATAPAGRPPTGRRKIRVHGRQPVLESAASETQTELISSCRQVTDEGETLYIDLSQGEAPGKHVTFGYGNSDQKVTRRGSDCERIPLRDTEHASDSETGPGGARGRSRQPRSTRTRVAKKQSLLSAPSSERSPASQPRSWQRTGNRSIRSRSPSSSSSISPGRGRFSGTSDSESTSRSRSRSKEKTFVSSDHDLKNSKNPKVLSWLRRKNRLIRRQKALERKKEQEKQREEEKKMLEEAERHAESEKKVKEWMREKRTEARLLQKREQMETSQKLKFDGTVVIDETVLITGEKLDLKEKLENVRVESGSVTNQETDHNETCDKYAKKRITGKEDTLKGTGGYSQTVNMDLEEERQARLSNSKSKGGLRKISHPDYSIRRRPLSAKKSSTSPRLRQKDKKASKHREESKSTAKRETESLRMSYDEWLKIKRKEDIRRKREEHKELKERMSNSDPELERVISEVAKKRVEQIKRGKKRIDTGIESVDNKANAYPEGASESEGEAREDSPKSTRFSWKLGENGPPHRPRTAKGKGQRAKRPASSLKGRPSTSRKFFRAPSPPKPSKSPAPGAIDKEDMGVVIPTPSRRLAMSPKPDVVASAYQKVRHQQASWDEFSDYVWDKINEDEGGEMQGDEVPEPMGCNGTEPEENKGITRGVETLGNDDEDSQKDEIFEQIRDSAQKSSEHSTIADSPKLQRENNEADDKASSDSEKEYEDEEQMKNASGYCAEEKEETKPKEGEEKKEEAEKERIAKETKGEEEGAEIRDEEPREKGQTSTNNAEGNTACQPPEIVIDNATPDNNAQDDDSRQGASSPLDKGGKPVETSSENDASGSVGDAAEPAANSTNLEMGRENGLGLERHTPCILDITDVGPAAQHEEQATFITKHDQE